MSSEQPEPAVAATASQADLPYPKGRAPSSERRLRPLYFAAYLFVLLLLFLKSLTRLSIYVAHSDLHSHALLVPFISGYLVYLRRCNLPTAYGTSRLGTILAGVLGSVTLALRIAGLGLSLNDDLSLMALSLVSFVVAGGFLFLGSRWMTAAAFPIAFLIFLVPLPDAVVNWLENASMLASTEAAALYFSVVGTPVVRHGTEFELPGITLRVAQECSGIHSSWVLFITSLLASNLFLTTRWRQVALVAFVIPLGVLRNGFRILVIGLLCVNVGPHMVDSPIHHRGGPVFFALSLLPLFLLACWLRRQERRRGASQQT